MIDADVPIQIDRSQNQLRLIVDIPADQQASVSQAIDRLRAEHRPVGNLIVESLLAADEQAYFWTPEWQAQEEAADADLASGRFKTFDSMDDMIAFLDTQ